MKLLFMFVISFASLSSILLAEDMTKLTVEELRIEKAQQSMPEVSQRFNNITDKFAKQIEQARNYTALTQLVILYSRVLWEQAVISFDRLNDFDDRPLYWARLKMSKALRQAPAYADLFVNQQKRLQTKLEFLSRGAGDIKFDRDVAKKILVTGFDPFFLDRNINQSNPSGAAALALDDLLISFNEEDAEIESVIFPVRFVDFDRGIVENFLTSYLKKHQIDMLVTISMGRENFDLERFPALRRSAQAPDNLNVYTGANLSTPFVPYLNEQQLNTPEFVEFSLPAEQMQKAQGPYRININTKITTLVGGKSKTFTAHSLRELKNAISVQGSGGGYLSNEVSYRSLILRDKYIPLLPVGHIHTPRVKGYSATANKVIIKQIKNMLSLAIKDI
jgi:pyrrolidone-carboxylate peptidase